MSAATEVETITAVIKRLAEGSPDLTADELAEKAMFEVGLPEDLHAVFVRIVRDECRRKLREMARGTEPAACVRPVAAGLPPRPQHTSASARPAWMRQRFSLPDGRMVLWGEATVADHEARIAMQLKLAGGIKRDIDQHKDAINRIKAHPGAVCLGDLPEYGGGVVDA